MPDKKIFIDTNIIIYALGKTSTKTHLAAPLFVSLPSISTQVLSEATNVASKRLALPVSEIRKLITSLEKTSQKKSRPPILQYGYRGATIADRRILRYSQG